MYYVCEECSILGDNYKYDEDGDLICICNECIMNEDNYIDGY